MRAIIPTIIIVAILIGGAYYWWQRVEDRTTKQPPESAIVNVGDISTSTQSNTIEEVEKMPVIASNPEYYNNVEGYFARPDASGSYPGVVMIHERWGLNENIRTMARELAAQGYQVLAVDLYDGTVATSSEQAGELSATFDQQAAIQNMQSAVDYLRSQNAQRVASLGWGFGGRQSFELALSDVSLNATIIYYGNLVSDNEELAQLNWPILGVFGEEDEMVLPEDVESFDRALTDLGIEHEIYMYSDVGHAFANPSNDNYAPQETADAWEKTTDFLRRHLNAK